MPSFLEQQLSKLAAPQTDIYKDNYKKASLLYDATQSNAYSRDDFFEHGLSGYQTLVKLEPGFSKYSHLFDRQSKDVQRFVEDVESNKQLDEALEGFLLLLSPYFISLTPAMKAMEWLLQRYYINEMNVDAVMMCILPYYDTPAFPRTLKVLNIRKEGRSGEQNQWSWLKEAQKSGMCLGNSLLFERWQYSAAFRHFCNSYLKKLLAVHRNEEDARPGLNLWVTIVVGGLARCAGRHHQSNKSLASEEHVDSVRRVLHICLKSSFPELVSGTYIILMQLAISLKLHPDLWNQIFALALKFCRDEKVCQLSCCLVTICQQQYLSHLEPSVVQQLQDKPALLQHLATKPACRRVASFLLAYAAGYVRWSSTRDRKDAAAVQQYLLELVDYVGQFLLQPLEASAVIRNLLESVCCCWEQLPSSELELWLPAVLEQLEQTYPDGYDGAVQHFTAAAAAATPAATQHRQVLALMEETVARKLAATLLQESKVAAVAAVEGEAGAVSRVRGVLTALQHLTAADSSTAQQQLVLAHTLLDSCTRACQAHQVCKSKQDWNRVKVRSSNTNEEERLSKLLETSIKVAERVEQVAWPLVHNVALACLPLLQPGEHTQPWPKELPEEEDPAQMSECESRVLLAVKLLHLLHARPSRAKDLLHQLLKMLGGVEMEAQLLSLVWGWQPYLAHHSLITAQLQVWCLEAALAMLEGGRSRAEDLRLLFCCPDQPLVPSLVSALTLQYQNSSDQRSVREAAGRLVTKLCEASHSQFGQSNYSELLSVLHQHSTAICMDHTSDHLVSVVSSSCSSSRSLLQSVVAAAVLHSQPPHLAAVMLFAVSQLQHKAIWEGLLPCMDEQLQRVTASGGAALPEGPSMLLYWSLVHLNAATAPLLAAPQGWRVFTAALDCTHDIIKLEGKLYSPQAVLVEQIICHKILRELDECSLSSEMWSALASAAADVAVGQKEAARLVRALKDSKLHARFVLQQIKQLQLTSNATTIRDAQAKRIKLEQTKNIRRSRKVSGNKKVPSKICGEDLPSSWRKLHLLLELLCEVQDVEEPWLLVETLCCCMQEAMALGLAIAEGVVQQILATLHHLISLTIAHPPHNTSVGSVALINVEMVVQCVRQSCDPYTHRRALMVLSLAASIQPEAVLHNLMSIFTFMGEGLLQRDDQFSYQVIESTVSTLVPILIEHSTSNSAEVCSIVQVFVDALPDIPPHRRMVVLGLLTSALDPHTHLWLVAMLIVKSYITHGSSRMAEDLASSGEGRRMPREISFALQLTEQFSVQQQVAAAHHILTMVAAVPRTVGIDYKSNWSSKSELVLVLGLKTLSAKQLRHFLYTSVGFLAQLFASDHFIATLVPVSESRKGLEVSGLQEKYGQIFSIISMYLTTVTEEMSSTRHDDLLAHKFWCSLQRKLLELLENVCSLLQPQLLLRVSHQLLQSPLTPVRVKALELLRTRLLPSAAFFSVADVSLLTELVGRLEELSCTASEPEECRQIALSALQMLLHFLAGHTQPNVDVLQSVLRSALLMVIDTGLSETLITQAILLVAECVSHVKQESVEVLSKLVPRLLTFLAPTQETQPPLPPATAAHDLLPMAATTALYKLVEQVPQFLSRYMEDLVTRMCRLSWQQSLSQHLKDSKLSHKLAGLASLLKDKIQPKVLLPALRAAFESLSSSGGESIGSVCGVLQLLQNCTARLDTADVTAHQPLLLPILTLALAARHNYSKDDSVNCETVEAMEAAAVQSVTHLVMRQDEAANLNLFSSLERWTDDLSSIHSRIAFYRLMEHLSSSLKVLFIKTHLADRVFSHAIHTLATTYKPNKKIKKRAGDSSVCLLLQHVLATFTNIFSNDSIGFTSETRFKQMLDPIVDQMINTVGGSAAYQHRLSEQLQPCLLQLCSAARNDALWSDLNKKMLMMLSQDLSPQVQAGVLSLTFSLISLLKEDWLQPLLSDTVPHVIEARDSSHAQVEQQACRLLSLMEEIMGDAVKEQVQLH